MLVRITNHCRMGCVHCMTESTPSGEHMTDQTFADALRLTSAVGLPVMLLSGGEPTDHPKIEAFIRASKACDMHTTVLSNGMFLTEDPLKRAAILDGADVVQVTNDTRFYPKFIPDFWHGKVAFERKLRMVSPFGRAKTNKLQTNQSAPCCFNLRSITRSCGDIRLALLMLASRAKMCSPSVNVGGEVVAGEAPSCAKIGHVTDSLDTLTRNVLSMRCNRCGLMDNLDAVHRAAVGE
jgi:Radical SAM superfamily